MAKVRRICAWCKKDLGEDLESSAVSDGGEYLTHGICDQCVFHVSASSGINISKYLERHYIPIILVDPEGKIKTGNAKARELLNKDFDQISGLPGGNVFECEYAYLPGGCGKTEHCSACSIRNVVMKSFETGLPLKHQEVYLSQKLSDDSTQELKFIVSTEKVSDTVLLIIESVGPSETNGPEF